MNEDEKEGAQLYSGLRVRPIGLRVCRPPGILLATDLPLENSTYVHAFLLPNAASGSAGCSMRAGIDSRKDCRCRPCLSTCLQMLTTTPLRLPLPLTTHEHSSTWLCGSVSVLLGTRTYAQSQTFSVCEAAGDLLLVMEPAGWCTVAAIQAASAQTPTSM